MFPFSINFAALSHAPPEFAALIAKWIPEIITPIIYPATMIGPNEIPNNNGIINT